MASVFAQSRVLRTCTARMRIQAALPARRALHQSAVALAKKKKTKGEMFQDDGDMFESSGMEDDLFKSSPARPAAPESKSKSKTGPKAPRDATVSATSPGKLPVSKKKNLTSEQEKRLERFLTLRKFTSVRIGLRPRYRKAPEQVRDTIWQQLFQLATTPEHMETLVRMFPKWRDMHRKFTPAMSEAFVRRCEELHCPKIALDVFSNHPKYGVDLNLAGARRLMHALHVKYPFKYSVLLSALYSTYNLPPVSHDIISCALFTSAGLRVGTVGETVVEPVVKAKGKKKAGKRRLAAEGKADADAASKAPAEVEVEASDAAPSTDAVVTADGSATTATAAADPAAKPAPRVDPNALTVAQALVPELQALLARTRPEKWAYPAPGTRAGTKARERTWLTWTLWKIERTLRRQGVPAAWLREWRESSGHVRAEKLHGRTEEAAEVQAEVQAA